MASFDQLSNSFKTSTQQRLNRLEDEVIQVTTTESDIDNLQARLKQRIEKAKEDINREVVKIEKSILSRCPNQNDPNYAQKDAQYQQFLTHSISGIDPLNGWVQNIFGEMTHIITSIISWFTKRFVDLARRIKEAFKNLLRVFF